MRTNRVNIVLIMVAFMLTIHLRIAPFFNTSFPLNDGGMFYRMVIDLQNNNYRLPQFTTYNNSSIPFAYPPLSFYLLGLLQKVFSTDLMTLFRYLPLALNLITIPCTFLLYSTLSNNKKIGLIATLVWAISVPSYAWLIMGGGVTRSLALLTYIVSMYFVAFYAKKGNFLFLVVGGMLGGITGLTHLEIFLVNCISIFILVCFRVHKWSRKLLALAVYAVITAAILSPYIFHLWQEYSFAPLVASFWAGEYSVIYSLMKLLLFNFTEEYGITILATIALLSLFYHLVIKRDYLTAIWFFALVVLDPRSANRSTVLPLALLAATGVYDLYTYLDQYLPDPITVHYIRLKKTLPILIPSIGFILFVQIYALNYLYENSISDMFDSITQEDMETVEWVNNHVAPESKFLLITPAEAWHMDHFSEWFPALTKQTSIMTIQGTEWISPIMYFTKRKDSEILRSCANFGLSCYQSEIEWENAEYILVNHENCSGEQICLYDLDSWLSSSPKFQKIYSSKNHSIFRTLELTKQIE